MCAPSAALDRFLESHPVTGTRLAVDEALCKLDFGPACKFFPRSSCSELMEGLVSVVWRLEDDIPWVVEHKTVL
jgi:hypothetical protein